MNSFLSLNQITNSATVLSSWVSWCPAGILARGLLHSARRHNHSAVHLLMCRALVSQLLIVVFVTALWLKRKVKFEKMDHTLPKCLAGKEKGTPFDLEPSILQELIIRFLVLLLHNRLLKLEREWRQQHSLAKKHSRTTFCSSVISIELRLYHNCDSTTIRLRYDYDKKLTCSFFACVELEADACDMS